MNNSPRDRIQEAYTEIYRSALGLIERAKQSPSFAPRAGFDKRYSERVPLSLEYEMQEFQRHGYVSADTVLEYLRLNEAHRALITNLDGKPSAAEADEYTQHATKLAALLREARPE